MNDLIKKEEELILNSINKFVKQILLAGFKNRKGQPVVKVVEHYHEVLTIDQEISVFRKKIIVQKMSFNARVFVSIGYDATASNDLNLFTNGNIQLIWDETNERYVVITPIEEVKLIDKTF